MSCSGPEVMGAQGLVSREGGPSLLPLSPPTWQAETRGKATSHLLSPDEGPSSTLGRVPPISDWPLVPALCPHSPELPSSAPLPAVALPGRAGGGLLSLNLSPPLTWELWGVARTSRASKSLLCAWNPPSCPGGRQVPIS